MAERKFCTCTTGCLMLKHEARRKGVECRYRHGQVKPLSWFVKPKPRKVAFDEEQNA